MADWKSLPDTEVLPPGHSHGIEFNGIFPAPIKDGDRMSVVMPTAHGEVARPVAIAKCVTCRQDCWISVNAKPAEDKLKRICYDCMDLYVPGWRRFSGE